MEQTTKFETQENNDRSDPSFDSNQSVNENQLENTENQGGIKPNDMKKESVQESDSIDPQNQETPNRLSSKSNDDCEGNSTFKTEVTEESEMETRESSENKSNFESSLDAKMDANESPECSKESQESETKSSHNQSEVSNMETHLTTQSEASQNGCTQNMNEPHSSEENRGEVNESISSHNNRPLECNNEEQSSRHAFDSIEGGGALDSKSNIESENQESGLDKQYHEGIKTCENNQESQTNSVTSDKMEEYLPSQPTQTTNETENVNEKIITENHATPSLDNNIQDTSNYSSNEANMCTSNAETKYQTEINTEHDFNNDRTNNGDVSSDPTISDPSAMTENNDSVKEEEMSTEAIEQQDPNINYENSKPNSPKTQQSTTTPPLSSEVPTTNINPSNQIKDDPYNFSEEEDVFSPQLPSRQFSSSNANDSNDPALERLKAENR